MNGGPDGDTDSGFIGALKRAFERAEEDEQTHIVAELRIEPKGCPTQKLWAKRLKVNAPAGQVANAVRQSLQDDPGEGSFSGKMRIMFRSATGGPDTYGSYQRSMAPSWQAADEQGRPVTMTDTRAFVASQIAPWAQMALGAFQANNVLVGHVSRSFFAVCKNYAPEPAQDELIPTIVKAASPILANAARGRPGAAAQAVAAGSWGPAPSHAQPLVGFESANPMRTQSPTEMHNVLAEPNPVTEQVEAANRPPEDGAAQPTPRTDITVEDLKAWAIQNPEEAKQAAQELAPLLMGGEL